MRPLEERPHGIKDRNFPFYMACTNSSAAQNTVLNSIITKPSSRKVIWASKNEIV